MIPGWYSLWCEAQGLNGDRPDRWPEDAKHAFMSEKLARFRLHWRWLAKIGQPEIIRAQSGRAELIRQVRRELDDALSPPPDSLGQYDHQSPYTQHRSTPVSREAEILATYEVRTYPDGSREIILPPRGSLAERRQAKLDPWKQIPIENVLSWVSEKPDRIGMSETSARCLMWLSKEFGAKVPA